MWIGSVFAWLQPDRARSLVGGVAIDIILRSVQQELHALEKRQKTPNNASFHIICAHFIWSMQIN